MNNIIVIFGIFNILGNVYPHYKNVLWFENLSNFPHNLFDLSKIKTTYIKCWLADHFNRYKLIIHFVS